MNNRVLPSYEDSAIQVPYDDIKEIVRIVDESNHLFSEKNCKIDPKDCKKVINDLKGKIKVKMPMIPIPWNNFVKFTENIGLDYIASDDEEIWMHGY